MIVHSNIATFAVAKFPLHKPQPEKEDRQQIQQIWEGFKAQRDAYVLKMIGYEHIISAIPFEGTISVGLDASSPGDLGFKESYAIKPLHKADVSKFQEILGYQEPLRIDYANKAEEILKGREEVDKSNRQFTRDVSRISFADTYHFAVGAITSTDRKSYNDFIGQARSYKRQIVDYLASKNVFSARAWFSSDKGKAEFVDLPVFRHQQNALSESLSLAVGDIFILLAWNIILFMGAYLSFLRYDLS